MSGDSPLALVVKEYERASAIRDVELSTLKAQIVLLEEQFFTSMSTVVKSAHRQGVSRYMVQKATGLPQPEVAKWFSGLSNSKPGRRKKDDLLYSGMRELLAEIVPQKVDSSSEDGDSTPAGWTFGEPRSNGVETQIVVTSPENVAYNVLASDQGDVVWFDEAGAELSLDVRLAEIPDEVETYVREAVWL